MNQPLHQRSSLIRVKALSLTALAAAVCLASGCGKKPATDAAQSSSSATFAPPTAPPSAAGNVPRTVPVAVAENADTSAQLAQLTQILRRYGMERRRVPQSLNELITAGYLTTLPAAPAGKQFAVDGKHMQVVLANR